MTAQKVRLVAGREVRERTRARSFRVGSAVVALLAVALVVLPAILPGGEDPEWTVAVVGAAPPELSDAVTAALAGTAATVELSDRGTAPPEALLDGGEVDAVLVDGRELVVDGGDGELERVMSAAVARAGLLERLQALDVDPGEAAAVLAAEPLQVRDLEGDQDDGAREGVASLGVVALFIAIATYGSWVLNSVLEEKANRVVEVVLTAVSPSELLAGKVIGAGVVGLVQLVTVALVAVVAVVVVHGVPDLPAGMVGTGWSLLLWFLLGFTFYAVGFAAAGSLVSRQEDAQSAVTPMLFTVMAAYFLSLIVVVPDPGGTAARVVSFLPPIAPLAMPARTAAGEVAAWEVGLAVVLMLVAIWLMVLVAARIYTGALLRTGARVPLRAALRGGAVEGAR